MMKKIKVTLVVLAIISGAILAVLFLQDRTKKLEDREYKDINTIAVSTDKANVNIYKSDNEKVKVVVYGSSKDNVEIVEGTKSITISKITGNTKCYLNCKNQVNIYIPDTVSYVDIKTEQGNLTADRDISRIKINSDSGNINLQKVQSMNIISKSSNVVVDTIDANRDSSIKLESGNVDINKVSNLNLDVKSIDGSSVIPYIREEQEFTLKIETKKGNINIEHHENKSE